MIGCGGISSGEDALEFARAGAAAVQLYTAFGYGGPGTCREIKDELAALLRKEGKTWQEVVREAVEKTSFRDVKENAPSAEEQSGSLKEASIQLLVQEAEELKRLLDGLGERIEAGDTQVIAVTPST